MTNLYDSHEEMAGYTDVDVMEGVEGRDESDGESDWIHIEQEHESKFPATNKSLMNSNPLRVYNSDIGLGFDAYW